MMEIVKVLIGAVFGAVGTITALVWIPAKDKAELDLKHYDMALRILNDNVTCQIGIRRWAVNILNVHSPDPAKLPADAQESLIGNGCDSAKPAATLPPDPTKTAQVTVSGGLVAQISSLETQGLKALLDKDLTRSANQFAAAYRLWPVYRTTDEIQRYLKSRATNPPATEADWKVLYRSIGKCDLFGVDRDVQNEFAKAAGFTDAQALAAQADSRACAK